MKFGRLLLRMARPFCAPFLNRLQLRIETAVRTLQPQLDDTREALSDTREALKAITERLGALDEMRDILGANAQRLQAFGNCLEQISAMESVAFDRFQLGLDAARLDNASLREEQAKHELGLENVKENLVSLREILQLSMSDIQTKHELILGNIGENLVSLRDILQLVMKNIKINHDNVRRTSQDTAKNVRDYYSSAKAQLDNSHVRLTSLEEIVASILGSADTLIQRSDIQLQRVAISLGPDLALRTPEGYLLSPAEDAATIVALYEGRGRLEPGTVAVIQHILRDGDCYVDVGANIGLTLLPAVRKLGPAGRAHAIEPTTRLQQLIHRSLSLNGVEDRVTLHRCACGSAPSKATLNLGAVHGHSSLLELPDAIGTEEVQVERLDDLIPPGKSIRLVKIDVEGFELEVLAGMTRILAENPAIAVLAELGPSHLKRAGTTIESWFRAFFERGFVAYEVDEQDGSLHSLREPSALALVHSVNILFLRQSPNAYEHLIFK